MGLHAEWEEAKAWAAQLEAEIEQYLKAAEDAYRKWWTHHHGGEVPADNIAQIREKALEELKAKELVPHKEPEAPEAPDKDLTLANSKPGDPEAENPAGGDPAGKPEIPPDGDPVSKLEPEVKNPAGNPEPANPDGVKVEADKEDHKE